METIWAGDPDFDYALAIAALSRNEPAEAIAPLERVVLSRPEHAGARLDLALTYLALGDRRSARLWLDQLSRHYEIPPSLATRVKQLRHELQAESGPGQWQQWIDVLAGYTSNANDASATRNFLLTPDALPPVQVRLDRAQQPQQDSFARLQWRAQRDALRQAGRDGTTRVELITKRHVQVRESDLDDLLLNHEEGWLHNGQRLGVLSQVRHVRLDAAAIVTQAAVSGQWQHGVGMLESCQGQHQLELGYRHDHRPDFGDPAWWSVQLGGQCRFGRHRLGAFIRHTDEYVRGERPGGDSRRQDVVLPVQTLWHPKLASELVMLHQVGRDRDGYSPLLESGARRVSRLWQWRVRLEYRPTPQVAWYAGLENHNEANEVSIFSNKSNEIFVGFGYKFR